MSNYKPYFITVDTEEIRDISIPDNSIEYEVIASSEQINEIEKLFKMKNTNAENAIKYLAKPFDEWGADNERADYDATLIMIYRKIFNLGTEETKKKIHELGLFK